MLRAVVDANVFVSAYVRPEGPPGQIVLRLLKDSAFELVLSDAIAEEVLRALAFPGVRKHARTRTPPGPWFEDIIMLATFVEGRDTLARLSSDPDDDKYVAAAVEGRAGFVVSGDRDLLNIGEYEGIRIVSPRTFLELL